MYWWSCRAMSHIREGLRLHALGDVTHFTCTSHALHTVCASILPRVTTVTTYLPCPHARHTPDPMRIPMWHPYMASLYGTPIWHPYMALLYGITMGSRWHRCGIAVASLWDHYAACHQPLESRSSEAATHETPRTAVHHSSCQLLLPTGKWGRP